MLLVVSAVAVSHVVHIFWFTNVTKPSTDGTNTTMECSKGSRFSFHSAAHLSSSSDKHGTSMANKLLTALMNCLIFWWATEMEMPNSEAASFGISPPRCQRPIATTTTSTGLSVLISLCKRQQGGCKFLEWFNRHVMVPRKGIDSLFWEQHDPPSLFLGAAASWPTAHWSTSQGWIPWCHCHCQTVSPQRRRVVDPPLQVVEWYDCWLLSCEVKWSEVKWSEVKEQRHWTGFSFERRESWKCWVAVFCCWPMLCVGVRTRNKIMFPISCAG